MRTRAVALAAVTAALVSTSALAAPAAKDPSTLILQKKDFPAGADYDTSSANDFDLKATLAKKGLRVGVAAYLGATFSAKQGQLQVKGAVITTPSVAQAKTAFTQTVSARQSFWKQIAAPYKPMNGIPSYGDQQQAFGKSPSVIHDGSIDVVVRKRTVVWVMEIVLSRQPVPKMSEIVADLNTYASKQKARVKDG